MPSSLRPALRTGVHFLAVALVTLGALCLLVPFLFSDASAAATTTPGATEKQPDRVYEGQLERIYTPATNKNPPVNFDKVKSAAPEALPSQLLPQPPVPEPETRNTDTCPTSAPSGTMRDGSEIIGVHEMCSRAVKNARTPEAAKAVIYAFNHLGTPYSMDQRDVEGYFDCSALVYRSYLSAGVTKFFSGKPYTGSWADESSWAGTLTKTTDHRAGDMRIMWAPGASLAGSAGGAGHAQLYLTNGYVIQSGGGADSRVNVAKDDTWGWGFQNFAYIGATGATVTDDNLPTIFANSDTAAVTAPAPAPTPAPADPAATDPAATDTSGQ